MHCSSAQPPWGCPTAAPRVSQTQSWSRQLISALWTQRAMKRSGPAALGHQALSETATIHLQKALSTWSWDITGPSVPSPQSGQPEHPSLQSCLALSKGNTFSSLLPPPKKTHSSQQLTLGYSAILLRVSSQETSAQPDRVTKKEAYSLVSPLSKATNYPKFTLLRKQSEAATHTIH